jgi:hypothetical protein
MHEMNRRKFMRTAGKIALAGATGLSIKPLLSGFVNDPSNVAFASESTGGFDVYNGVNPNSKDIVANTFKDCLSKGFAPGICYKTSKPMVAVARGTVSQVGEWNARAGYAKSLGDDPMGAKGYFVRITQGSNFVFYYYHLKEPEVKFGQKIKRGDRIGLPDKRWNLPRFLLLSGWGGYGIASDPNNFGISHGFMTYWDGTTDLDISKEEQNQRFENQNEILNKIAEMVEGPEKYDLLRKKHKGKDQLYGWTPIEKFRYIEYLIENKPETFPSLKKEQFTEMKKEFYSNQPIVLTLPFRKG